MHRTLALSAALLVALTFASAQALAADEGQAQHDHASQPYPLAIDPLGDSLADVEKPIVVMHEGRELRFASQSNLEKFRAKPDHYLPDVDARIIAQQKPAYPLDNCVVSGQKLGSMGEPVDYVYGNRLARFCCGGCEATLKQDPAKYFSKIDAAVVEAQKADYPMDTCVISGGALGGMGEPADYVIGTQLVRFCCDGCIETFEKNPARYLSTIDAHRAEKNSGGDKH